VTPDTTDPEKRRSAYGLIILFGNVAMVGDIVYEGGRSVSGPFLFTPGGSAFMVAFIAGFGEFLGYAIRIATGYLADKSRQYRAFIIAGYLMIGAIPLLLSGVREQRRNRTRAGVTRPANSGLNSGATSGS
jgi:hypothetical protein